MYMYAYSSDVRHLFRSAERSGTYAILAQADYNHPMFATLRYSLVVERQTEEVKAPSSILARCSLRSHAGLVLVLKLAPVRCTLTETSVRTEVLISKCFENINIL